MSFESVDETGFLGIIEIIIQFIIHNITAAITFYYASLEFVRVYM